MKKAMKKAARAAFLALMCAIFILSSCATGEYKKNVNAKESADTLAQKTPTESKWIGEDQDFIKEYIEIPEYVKESQVYYAQNTNDLDEFGIFWVEDGKGNAVRSMLTQGYLQKRYNENQEWYNSYMPTQTPKLRDAEVRVYGNCVVYAVLSSEQRTAFFAECEKLLKN